MPDVSGISRESRFLYKVREIVLSNLENEDFSVVQLAEEYGFSRSNLHKKIKKYTGKSISQFIREIRLEEAMKMLGRDEGTVSEIAYRVGFGSPTYFNTCFKEYYGFPPGEVRLRSENANLTLQPENSEPLTGLSSRGRGGIFESFISLVTSNSVLLPVGILLLLLLSAGLYLGFRKTTASGPLPPENSLIVLPFTNVGKDPGAQAFANAMLMEINSRLVKHKGLLVLSDASLTTFGEEIPSLKEVSQKLQVASVLRGSIQQIGLRYLIAAQLIDARKNQLLWSEVFNIPRDSIFIIQGTIAKAIAEQLTAEMPLQFKEGLRKEPTDNMEAYNLFLQVLQNYGKPEENIQKLWQAIQLDPGFSAAYVRLAIERIIQIHSDKALITDAFEEFVAEIKKLLQTAIAVDPTNAEAYRVMASTCLWFERDLETAAAYYRKGEELSPGTTHGSYIEFLLVNGEYENAVAYSSRHLQVVPGLAGAWFMHALCYRYIGDREKSEVALQRAIILGKEAGFINKEPLLFVLTQQGKFSEVLKEYEALSTDENISPLSQAMGGIAYCQISQKEKTLPIIERLCDLSQKTAVGSPAYHAAMLLAYAGEIDKAFEWLYTAIKNGETRVVWLNVEPLWKPLRNDFRWEAVLKDAGFKKKVKIPESLQ